MSNLIPGDWKAPLAQINPSYQKALVFGAWGALGGAIGALLGEIIHQERASEMQLIVMTALWFGVVGICIGVAILVGYANYLKRGLQIGESVTGGALIGLIAGAVAGAAAQFLYGSLGRGEFLRIVCWGIAGGLLGLGLSYRIQNLGLWRGLGGGATGGIVGGALFVLLVVTLRVGGTFGRISGIAVIGFFIGLMIVLAEAMFREAWLEVRYGPKETRNISLGREAISVGGDASACTIYARNAPAVAFRYKLDQGRITCEDVAKGHTSTIQPGSSQVVGNLTVTVRAAGASVQAAAVAQPAARTTGGFSLRLSTGKTLSLADGMKLSAADIPGLQSSSAAGMVAEVGRNPNDPNILGLKNLSRTAWTATLANRDRVQIDPGRNVRVAAGTKISFGSVSADIETT
jgi:hypothetical protein